MLNLDQAVVYDIETFPNVFTLTAELLNSNVLSVWEISEYRNDVRDLVKWFTWLHNTQTPMIGFNNEHFDYSVIHQLMRTPLCDINAQGLYQIAMAIINSNNRFEFNVWPKERFAPQIDLFKIHHFDNRAKTTSLKALEINMRSKTVVDPIGSKIPLGQPLTQEQIQNILIPYNIHDVRETKRFAKYSTDAINFRAGLIGQLDGDVMNFNDTKIGEKMLEQRLGESVCYMWQGNRRVKRQTVRHEIKLSEIIFPYVQFQHPEFNRMLEYMKAQTLRSDEFDNIGSESSEVATIKTKGVFTGLKANFHGLEFHFGTGGIHGSVSAQRIESTAQRVIEDIDVRGLYPEIAITNGLAPEHLGQAFVTEYAKIPQERKQHKKGTVQNASFKLAANGAYGKSNSKFSVLYDPKFTMTITINGQLLLCMLAERLARVPGLQFVQINTDGITYIVDRNRQDMARSACDQWERETKLVLERAEYSRMWIRDVNNYVAEYAHPNIYNIKRANAPDDAIYCGRPSKWENPFRIGCDGDRDQVCDRFEREVLPNLDVSELKGKPLVCYCAPERCHCESLVKKANGPKKLKTKGAYWSPDPHDYANSITNAGPPAWHKDFNPVVVTRAAVASMVHGIDPELFIKTTVDPFDFMCRVKVDRNSKLMLGDQQIQSTTRYYIARNGQPMRKISPPAGNYQIGQFKRASKISDKFYNEVMAEIGPNVWDARIHTKNKSTYQMRETTINVGWSIAECNDVDQFDWSNLNYDFYIAEAQKLII